MSQQWNSDAVPNLSGKIAIVTGANIGLGYETARVLVGKGAHVIVASRDVTKGQEAVRALQKEYPTGKATFLVLDLANLASVRQFAQQYSQQFKMLDLLINNAGVMHLPYRTTVDGFEMQFGTNHLGHFALTGLLLPVILNTPGARVVTVSSSLHQSGHINFEDLHGKTKYNESTAYSQSKLANVLFAYELQRKFSAHSVKAFSMAAHPGYAATNLQFGASNMTGSALRAGVMSIANTLFAQSAAMGALPTLYAATAPAIQGGEYVGPSGFMEIRGYPKVTKSNTESHDLEVAKKLWDVSEELTGISYHFGLVPA